MSANWVKNLDTEQRTCPQPAAFLSQRTRITPSAYVYTSFASNLVLAKTIAVGKTQRQPLLFDCWLTGGLLRGHIAIIRKLSPHYVLSTLFSVHDVVLVPGLLPILLHGCEIKSGSSLGTRLPTYHSLHVHRHIITHNHSLSRASFEWCCNNSAKPCVI